MNTTHFNKIAVELGVQLSQVKAAVELLDEGGTVPFISRYRKEATGSLDEVAIAIIRDRIAQLRDLDKRREAILRSLEELEKLSPELEAKVNAAETMAALEDIYLPYKPKRRTKATIAREKGLEPLAKKVFEQQNIDITALAHQFLDQEKGVGNVDEALKGARDIIAEWVNEDQDARGEMRELFLKEGKFRAHVMTGKEEDGEKYKDYFEWEEDISKAPSHRVLAMRRGEKEMILMLDTCPEEESGVSLLNQRFVHADSPIGQQVEQAVKDSYRRLMKPSMETEIRLTSKKKADEEAINVFAENLRQLLLSAPLGQQNVLALDPGFRTGCKLVCLDRQGKLVHNDVIFPQWKEGEASAKLRTYCSEFQIEAIAIGNGTASRETESFVRGLNLPKEITIVVVNESGASIYSASDVAREEFPDQDVTVRGAVSIGRRLMDPLAELVKIDPKSIGVGQYQHDVDQAALKRSLDDVVMSCVNAVGVEVNTSSKQLLTYVSGLGPQLAQNIVNYRNENGPFKSRAELKKVPRLGSKAFEQAAGFLRIRDAVNPLDRSAVHPESYSIVKEMAKDLNCQLKELITDSNLKAKIELKRYLSDSVGLPTLTDILEELTKPGRDPRDAFEAFAFDEGVHSMEDLKGGMQLKGLVTNITKFGAFVDIGVHQDGLVHISHLADKFVSDPTEVVKVQQKVEVTVLEVDISRKRISLSMKSNPMEESPKRVEKKTNKKKNKPKSTEGDFQDKLAMLKGKFK